MRVYAIKDQEHEVYDLKSELPDGIVINPDWKNARVGDWVLTDDDAYIQILDRKKIGKSTVVVTCIGTYPVTGSLDTEEREDRFTLGGKSSYNTTKNRKNLTQREVLFAQRIAKGEEPVAAYLAVYNAKNKTYASSRAALLMKTERITTRMNPTMEELKKVFAEMGVDLSYLIQSAKDQVDGGKNGSDKLNALKMLWEAFGVVEKKKITEIAGIFQGFEPKKIEEVKRPALPEHQALGDDLI
jgi:transcriptional regulator with XRE-family HTH domain